MFNKILRLITKHEDVVPAVVPGGVEVMVDRLTELPEVPPDAIKSVVQPSFATIVPPIMVDAKQHVLSVLSTDETERAIYVDRSFRAPEMTLECLFDQYWFPEYGFLVSKDGKVWRHSILGQYGDPNFLTTYAVEDRDLDDGSKGYFFHEHLLQEAVVIDEPSIITSHYASHNYGHFMMDMVPLIQQGMKLGLSMISKPLLDWQKPIYERIGVNMESVTEIPERAVFLKKVFVSIRHNAVSTYAASPHHRSVFEAVLKNIPKGAVRNPKKKIFLSRGASRSRNLRNRPDLEVMLQQHGFEIVQPEKLSFDEQALVFLNAEVIVSEFGAVMANVVFCKPNTKVVEIIPDMQNDPWSRHLCASLGLEHVTLCQLVKESDREEFDITGKLLTNLYFSYDANIDMIEDVIRQL